MIDWSLTFACKYIFYFDFLPEVFFRSSLEYYCYYILGVVISELKTYITNSLMKATIKDPDYLEVKIGVFKKE